MVEALLWAAGGTGFACLMTMLGASVVLVFHKSISLTAQRLFLGFAAGIMIAASVWSLLIPALESAENAGQVSWVPVAGGFVLGVVVLMALNSALPHLHPGEKAPAGPPARWKRSTLLFTAVTLHNIPEGMSVGLLFALAAQNNDDPAILAMAIALAVGIAVQNVPEGAAVALPLRQEGMSTGKAFLLGSLSGVVEPVFGIAVVLVAGAIAPYMPWLLALAAGAMMYVVVEELIPEAHLGERSNVGTLGVMGGFLFMMVLDVALG